MTKIIMCGCNGKMGRVITESVSLREDCEIVAGLDINQTQTSAYPVVSSVSELHAQADVLIDFSHPALLPDLLAFAKEKKIPLVLCTTGYSKDEVEAIEATAQEVAVFYSGNMSLGINLMIELSKKAATVFGNSFDIEIVEKHHNQKIDAPSGTALMIADAISSVMEESPQYVYDRHSYRKARGKHEIGIHSIRGGTIVGEHEVIFAGHDELFTLTHTAQSKEIFATGAINAAVYLAKQTKPGMYNMSDLLAEA